MPLLERINLFYNHFNST